MQTPKPEAEPADLPAEAVRQPAVASIPTDKQTLADAAVADWNALHESVGSFADQHSTL
jgi:hypothetical protein